MSRRLVERVWGTHPLPPQARLVLLAVAGEVPDGQAEARVVRSRLGSALEMSAGAVSHALRHGERAGLVEIGAMGRVTFRGEELPLVDPVPSRSVGEAVAPSLAGTIADTGKGARANSLLRWFREAWHRRYGCDYVLVRGRDYATAHRLVVDLTLPDLKARIARFFAEDDPFYLGARHSFAVFGGCINRLVPLSEETRDGMMTADQTSAYMKQLREGGRQ